MLNRKGQKKNTSFQNTSAAGSFKALNCHEEVTIYNILFVFDTEPENYFYSYLIEENYLHHFLVAVWLNLLLMGSGRASSVLFCFVFFC